MWLESQKESAELTPKRSAFGQRRSLTDDGLSKKAGLPHISSKEK
jgi:hypothetical protein